jgi:hypothetical protein
MEDDNNIALVENVKSTVNAKRRILRKRRKFISITMEMMSE